MNKIGFISASLILAAGCDRAKIDTGAKLNLKLPTIEQLSKLQSASFQSKYDYKRACLAVNVTSSDIPSTQSGVCDISVGVFSGFYLPGALIEVEVARGSNRKLELFSFLRNSESDLCPTSENFKGLDVSHSVRLAQVDSFDAVEPEVHLTITLTDPPIGSNLISQYKMPAVCLPYKPSSGSARINSGQSLITGGNYKVMGSLSGVSNEFSLTSSKYKMRFTRTVQ